MGMSAELTSLAIPHWIRHPDGIAFSDVPTRPGGQLPDFYVIGSGKAGTTALNDFLCQHPQIHMNPLKEPHYFSTDLMFERGLDWYKGLYADAQPNQICGEASTSYTRWPSTPHTPRRIHEVTPRAKLLYLVREPVSRVISECLQFIKYNRYVMNDPSLPLSVDAALDYILDEKNTLRIEPIATSEYIVQIEKYLDYFSDDQIVVLLHEDLTRFPQQTLKTICEFLGVDHAIPIDFNRQLNVTDDFKMSLKREQLAARNRKLPGYQIAKNLLPQPVKEFMIRFALRNVTNRAVIEPMSAARKEQLANHFKPYNDRLASYMERDLSYWNA
jgi:Sulfotransferase domain